MPQRSGAHAQILCQRCASRPGILFGKGRIPRIQCGSIPLGDLLVTPALIVEFSVWIPMANRHTSPRMTKNTGCLKATGAFLGKKKAPTYNVSAHSYPRHNEEAPLQTSPLPCNSTALALRDLSLVHDLPSQSIRPNGGYSPTTFAVLVTSLRSQCRPRWVLYPCSF